MAVKTEGEQVLMETQGPWKATHRKHLLGQDSRNNPKGTVPRESEVEEASTGHLGVNCMPFGGKNEDQVTTHHALA